MIEHPVALEEVEGWVAAMHLTHLQGTDDVTRSAAAWRRGWQPERAWGVRDAAGRWVATLYADDRTLTIPGGAEVPADALTAVAVAATHRRQGLMSRMLTGALAEAHDRGDPVAILIAAEWPIYGRFGYAPATVRAAYRFHSREAGPITFGDPSRVRQVTAGELVEIGPAVFDAARAQRFGDVNRDTDWWAMALGLDGLERPPHLNHHWFVHDGPDGPDGFVGWKPDPSGDFDERQTLIAFGPVTASEAAYFDIWAYLAGIDLVDHIELGTRSLHEPVRWALHDGRALQQRRAQDHYWLRILDVPAALTARGYESNDALVLEVLDDAPGGYAAGRFALDGSRCTPTDAPADVELDQRALASIYLGGYRLSGLPGVIEHTPGAAGRLDRMFATALPPFSATWF